MKNIFSELFCNPCTKLCHWESNKPNHNGTLVTFHNVLYFYGEGLLAPAQLWCCKINLRWLPTTASTYSWLQSISWGHLLHTQPEDAPCHSNKRSHLTFVNSIMNFWFHKSGEFLHHLGNSRVLTEEPALWNYVNSLVSIGVWIQGMLILLLVMLFFI
jgi:hypothetical protein